MAKEKTGSSEVKDRAITTAADNRDDFKKLLNSQLKAIQKSIPKYITPERLFTTAVAAAARLPKLFECTPVSIARSFIACAEMGLDFTHELGHAYMIPFERGKGSGVFDAVLIIGYKGWVTLIKRAGRVVKVITDEVFEAEIEQGRFKFRPSDDEPIRHDKLLFGDRGKVVGYYVVFVFKGGEKQAEYMTIEEINKIRSRSKAKNSGPWVTDFKQMARKTVLKRGVNYIEKDVTLARAVDYDNEQFGYDETLRAEIDGADKDSKSREKGGVERLKDRLAGGDSTEAHEQPEDAEFELVDDGVAKGPKPEAETDSDSGDEAGAKVDGEPVAEYIEAIRSYHKREGLEKWLEDNRVVLKKLPKKDQTEVFDAYRDRFDLLQQQEDGLAETAEAEQGTLA